MSSPIVPFRTQQQVSTIYSTAALALNNSLDLTNPGDWNFKSNTIGSVGSGLSQDLFILQKQMFAQTASGSNLDSMLSALNLAPRAGNLPALGQTVFASAPSTGTYTIAQGQSFTNSLTNVTYQCTQTTIVTDVNYATTPIPIACTQLGTGFAVPASTVLTISSPIGGVSNFTVTSMSDGVTQETDGEVSNRIIFNFQNPPGGGSPSNFVNWAQKTSGVTSASVFIIVQEGLNNINVVLFGGSSNSTTILNSFPTPGTFTRAVPSLIPTVSNYIQSVRPVNDTVTVTTTETFLIPLVITVSVTLTTGFSLSTNIPSEGLTVIELIQREVRRAIVSVPPQGINIDGTYIIPISLISQTLDAGLSASPIQTGIYASILLDRDVIYNGAFQAIQIPTIANDDIFDPDNGYALVVYDIVYANINVVLA